MPIQSPQNRAPHPVKISFHFRINEGRKGKRKEKNENFFTPLGITISQHLSTQSSDYWAFALRFYATGVHIPPPCYTLPGYSLFSYRCTASQLISTSTFGDPPPFLRVPKLLCGKLLHADQLDSYRRFCCRKETKIGFEEVVIRLHPTSFYWQLPGKLKRGSKSTSLAEKFSSSEF